MVFITNFPYLIGIKVLCVSFSVFVVAFILAMNDVVGKLSLWKQNTLPLMFLFCCASYYLHAEEKMREEEERKQNYIIKSIVLTLT